MNSSKALIQQYFATLSGQSDVPVTEYFSADIRWNLPPAHPFGGPFIGIAAVLEMMEQGSGFFPYDSIGITLRALIAEKNDVVAHFSLSAKTHAGEDYANEYLFRFKCSDGKIVEVWEFLDTYYQFQAGLFN
ncbi:nuclear transport factor 2 family protein [Denitrificimonas sp. JX-1]|uniref:Nuclear transport factor 2 family protein n=1 Tax=Denitrificimonas halotolerans TaxID=3098930 RepID=A0ABU5GQX3_9GAMM|nr:nuclear transport factor 2 family protein [Denitrificimonas sp. JX-1]MDY7218008.1 nuclear transport factor 2 family protein [Denitrificimonas sp. JX-1]